MGLWVFLMVKVIVLNVLEINAKIVQNRFPSVKLMILMLVDILVKLMGNGKKEYILEFIEIMLLFNL
jgi:hypothetical protein